MNEAWIIIIVLFAILILIGILVITFYNKLLFRKNKAKEKFKSMSECLNERTDIINKLTSILQSNDYFEESLLRELKSLKEEIDKETKTNYLISLIEESDKVLEKALNLDNIYDHLKNNQDFLNVKEQFKNNQYKLMYTKEIYNEEAEAYNNYKNKGISKIIAKLFKMPDYNYYKK